MYNVKSLLTAGAEPNRADRHGVNLLYLAAQWGHKDVQSNCSTHPLLFFAVLGRVEKKLSNGQFRQLRPGLTWHFQLLTALTTSPQFHYMGLPSCLISRFQMVPRFRLTSRRKLVKALFQMSSLMGSTLVRITDVLYDRQVKK